MPTRLSSSITRSMAVSCGDLPRIFATSARVLPVSGFSLSFLKATSRIFSGPAATKRFSQASVGVAISFATFARVAGSFRRAIQASRPPSCTQGGMAASRPVAPAV